MCSQPLAFCDIVAPMVCVFVGQSVQRSCFGVCSRASDNWHSGVIFGDAGCDLYLLAMI